LTPRNDGRWCKKVRGKLHIFAGTADQALEEWLRVKDDLLAGRTAPPKSGAICVADLVNHFLTYKQQLRESGELAPRTFDRYFASGAVLVGSFGRNRPVDDLTSDDFQALRGDMAKRWGPVALGNEIQMARSVFRYGFEAGLIDKPMRFGPGFKKPSAKTLRKSRTAGGPKLFTPEQLQALLKAATPNMAAMILLGINGGLGNTDLAEMPTTAVDLDGGWLDYPRVKTGMARRIPLWQETVAAIRNAMKGRPDTATLLFIGPRGTDYIGNHKGYRVHQEFTRVADKAKVAGRTFYDLRRTFQTVAEGARDLVAVQSIMGHAPASGDMSACYRQSIDDDRLRATVNHVRVWLWPAAKKTSKKGDLVRKTKSGD
jgi:integrase